MTAARSVVRILTTTLLVGLVLATPSAPAVAHDQLIDSSPSADQLLDAMPTEVVLRFSAEVLPIGAAVLVTSDDGTDWVNGEPVLVDDTVTATVDPAAPRGSYQIRWRVVSSDGHAITGAVPFVVDGAEPADTRSADGTVGDENTTPEPAATPPNDGAQGDDPARGEDGNSDEPATVGTGEDRASGENSWVTATLWALGALLAVGVTAVVILRRRRSVQSSATSTSLPGAVPAAGASVDPSVHRPDSQDGPAEGTDESGLR